MKKCVRCKSINKLEKDHIIPRSRGGTDEDSNKRFLCQACHDFRHAKDNILKEINGQLSLLGTGYFNSVRFTMWIMRLGVLEAFNTPKKIRDRGIYISYWKVPTTHYQQWYPQIKLQKLNKELKKASITKKLSSFEAFQK